MYVWLFASRCFSSSDNMIKAAGIDDLQYMHPLQSIGYKVRCALVQALQDDRVIVGLSATIKNLSTTPSDALFCLLAPSTTGDSANHMHAVLLEAYCYENGIYTIKVDQMQKLSNIVGAPKQESCVLIRKSLLLDHEQCELFSAMENALVDHCEEYWDVPNKPIIQLPDS